jgi:hypothetical protein
MMSRSKRPTYTYSSMTAMKGLDAAVTGVLNVFTSRAYKCQISKSEQALIFESGSPKMMFMSGSVAPAPTDATKAAAIRIRSRCEE